MAETIEQFRRSGYLRFASVIDEPTLAMLQQTCDTLLEEPVHDGGGDRHKIGLGEARRFLAHRHAEFPALDAFVMSDTMGDIVKQTLGVDGYLFNEQFVVKGADIGASFAWHQDSYYVGFDHKPYLTVWIALDDTTEDNGCVYVLPRNLDEESRIEPHEWQAESREYKGYDGNSKGEPMVCEAGSVVAFSSLTLHRSGENHTGKPRRAYICQYSVEPLIDPASGNPKRFARKLGTQ